MEVEKAVMNLSEKTKGKPYVLRNALVRECKLNCVKLQ